jgi:hypothetical protein
VSGLDSAAVGGREFKLPRGPNAPVELGGLFVTPYRE